MKMRSTVLGLGVVALRRHDGVGAVELAAVPR